MDKKQNQEKAWINLISYLQAAMCEMWSLLSNFGFLQLKVNRLSDSKIWNALNPFLSFKEICSVRSAADDRHLKMFLAE